MTGNTLPTPGDLTPQNFQFLQDHVYRRSGIVLGADKDYLLQARLAPIVTEQRLETLNDLCALLRSTRDELLQQNVVEAMTTNETLFFRDPRVWQGLKTVVQEIMEIRQTTRTIRIWSAASSSGQEAYSLVMMLLELGLGDWNLQVLGTDLSTKMVQRAREGKFSQLEVNRGLGASYLIKYFTRDGLGWQVNGPVRYRARFELLDLRKPLNLPGPFDLVLCRNVLIYFDLPTRTRIIDQIRTTLYRGAHLVLGSSETAIHPDCAFAPRAIGPVTFYQAR